MCRCASCCCNDHPCQVSHCSLVIAIGEQIELMLRLMLRLTAGPGAMYNCTAYKFSKLALVTSIADTVNSQMLEGDHLIMFSMFLHWGLLLWAEMQQYKSQCLRERNHICINITNAEQLIHTLKWISAKGKTRHQICVAYQQRRAVVVLACNHYVRVALATSYYDLGG